MRAQCQPIIRVKTMAITTSTAVFTGESSPSNINGKMANCKRSTSAAMARTILICRLLRGFATRASVPKAQSNQSRIAKRMIVTVTTRWIQAWPFSTVRCTPT